MIRSIVLNTAANKKTAFFKEDGSHHDRSKTVGGSEVGQCIRKTWFNKQGVPTDPEYTENWGYFQRGHQCEEWIVNTIKEGLPDGWQYLYTSQDQVTLIDQQVSATPDGLIITDTGEQVVLEIKSLDPRSNLDKPKQHHIEQTQLQIELFHKLTPYHPTRGLLLYLDASDFSHLVEHKVERNPEILEQAFQRAERIYSTASPTDLYAEGAWDNSCRYCGYIQRCGEAVLNAIPTSPSNDLFGDELLDEIDILIRDHRVAKEIQQEAKIEQKRVEEQIKIQLRNSNTTRIQSDNWTLSYGKVNGRRTLDTAAVEKAGINLDPFYKTSPKSDRLTIWEKQ